MTASRFLDTSILVYACDLDAPEKRTVALRLVENRWATLGGTAISVQVLQELFVNLVREGHPPAVSGQIVNDFAAWPIVDNPFALLQSAFNEQVRW